jgi:hypothetical protein
MGHVVELEEEGFWLRHRVGRLRAALRIAAESRVEAILCELINDAENLSHISDAGDSVGGRAVGQSG